MNLVILTEEPSMKVTLEHLLPKLGVDAGWVTIIPFEGKSDLEQSIPGKLRGWQAPDTRFLIVRDNDRGDCAARKAHLAQIAEGAGKAHATKVRIVCQELEAWFLADVPALRSAGYVTSQRDPSFAKRDPDSIHHPVRELQRLRPGYGKGTGAAEIAPHLDPDNARSSSFRSTVQAIRELTMA